MENTLKQKLAAGAQPIGTFFDTASVSLMECLGRTGLDFAIIDNEHSPIEAETTAALVRAAELSGICPIARVREISRPAMLKLLDVGVQGLIVPNVKTLEQVQELVNYAKYYPIGQRGFCPSRKDGWGFDGLGSVPETMRHFNGETLLFPQCETAEALDIIEDICAVDGVDGIFVGPFDLSISMGMPGQFDAPEFQAAITRIVAACRAAEKYCMFFTGTADGVVDGFRRGFDAMAYSLDAALFIQGVKRDVEDIRSRLSKDMNMAKARTDRCAPLLHTSMLIPAEGSLVVRPAAVEQPVGRLVIGRHLVVRQLTILVLTPPLEQLVIAQLLERERQTQFLRHRQEHVLGHHVPDLETAGIAVHRLLHARLQGGVGVVALKKFVHIRFRFVCHIGHS